MGRSRNKRSSDRTVALFGWLLALLAGGALVVWTAQVVVPVFAVIVVLALCVDAGALVYARGVKRPARGMRITALVLRPLAGLLHAFEARLTGRTVRARTLDQLLALSPRDFELEIGALLRAIGYRDVRHVGGKGDLGIDLRAVDQHGRSVGVQCKRYGPTSRVSSRDMQLFVGMLFHHGLEHGLYVTTSTVTDPARALARAHCIELIEADQLARLVAARSLRAGLA